jgi:hypothetical protein
MYSQHLVSLFIYKKIQTSMVVDFVTHPFSTTVLNLDKVLLEIVLF